MDNVHLLSQGLPLVGQAFIDREQFGEMLQIEIEVLSLDQLLNLSFQWIRGFIDKLTTFIAMDNKAYTFTAGGDNALWYDGFIEEFGSTVNTDLTLVDFSDYINSKLGESPWWSSLLTPE